MPDKQLGEKTDENLRLVVPSDGEMYESTLGFLSDCGLRISRGNSRRYVGQMTGFDDIVVLFQRAADITSKVEEGSADIGIVGLDRFDEYSLDDGDAFMILDNLNYSSCDLVIAVPEGWIDVTEMNDLADLAVDFRDKGRELRVATKYPKLTSKFFFDLGIYYFTIVQSSGSLEAAPIMGFADLIVDISATGTTLRENQLKTLSDGTMLKSQACLIGNRASLGVSKIKMDLTRQIIERIKTYLESNGYSTNCLLQIEQSE